MLALLPAVLRRNRRREETAEAGDAVHVGETLEVAAGAKLKLLMNDGSVIAIASGGLLTIADYRVGDGGESRDATLSLSEGLLRAVVSTLKGPPHFEVDTATGVAAVRSTDWFIEAQPGSTQVGVLEGRVSLKSVATGKEIVIPAHWGARVEAGRDPVPARVWTGAEFDNFIRQPSIRFLQNNFPSPPLLLYSGRGSAGAEGDNCGACRGCRRP